MKESPAVLVMEIAPPPVSTSRAFPAPVAPILPLALTVNVPPLRTISPELALVSITPVLVPFNPALRTTEREPVLLTIFPLVSNMMSPSASNWSVAVPVVVIPVCTLISPFSPGSDPLPA